MSAQNAGRVAAIPPKLLSTPITDPLNRYSVSVEGSWCTHQKAVG